jgi:hypothetical protein
VYLLRGEIWPQKYLNAWRTGQQLSPKNAIKRLIKEDPLGCTRSRADTEAAHTQKNG